MLLPPLRASLFRFVHISASKTAVHTHTPMLKTLQGSWIKTSMILEVEMLH